MSRIRRLISACGFGIERKSDDDAYQDWLARYEGEPQLKPCGTCGSNYCGPAACRLAPAEPTQPTDAPRCRYAKDEICDCRGRLTCLDRIGI